MIVLIGLLVGLVAFTFCARLTLSKSEQPSIRVIAGICGLLSILIVVMICVAAVNPDAHLFGQPVIR